MGQTYLAQVARIVATSIDLNTDIFSANLSPLKKGQGRFPVKHTIQIILSSSRIIKVMQDEAASTNVRGDLNSGAAIPANATHHFDVYLYGDDSSYNLQLHNGSATVDCQVVESEGNNS